MIMHLRSRRPFRCIGMAIAFVALLADGCAPRVEPADTPNIKLPNFDVWIPHPVLTTERLPPANGQYKIETDGSAPIAKNASRTRTTKRAFIVDISWNTAQQTAAWTDDRSAQAVAKVMADAGTPISNRQIISPGRWVASIKTKGTPLALGVARCEPWLSVQIFVLATRYGVNSQALRKKSSAPSSAIWRRQPRRHCGRGSNSPPTMASLAAPFRLTYRLMDPY
jgi:hypothetical protein